MRLCALLLSLTLLSPVAVRAADAEIIQSLDAQRVVELLREAGFTETEVDSDGDVYVAMQGYRPIVLVGTYKGRSLAFRFALAGTSANADTVNTFDLDTRYGRAYLDKDGDPVLESDLDLEGGVTPARVKDFFRTCNELMVRFLRAVL